MKHICLETPDIKLRACEPEDLSLMYEIENDTALWETGCTTVPYSRYALKQYIAQTQNDIYTDKQLRLIIVHKADNATIGIIDLADFEPQHNRAATGIIIKSTYRKQGLGHQALMLLRNYAFRFLHLHQLYAYIAADNQASLQLFEKCGFTPSAHLKDWIRESSYHYADACLLQCINPEASI